MEENPTLVMMEAGFRAAGLKKWRYLTLEVGPEKLDDAFQALKTLGFKGINLTSPIKLK